MIIGLLSLILFILLALIGKERGVTTAFTILFNTLVMILYIRGIMKGFPLILFTIVATFLFMVINLFVQNGYNVKTRVSFVSVVIILLLISLYSIFVIQMYEVGGFSDIYVYDEDLQYFKVNIGRNSDVLFMCATVTGTLGALIDSAISIATAVNEVYVQNPGIEEKKLFISGIYVGRDILGTTINTLLFAQAGEGFFVWMIYLKQHYSFLKIINSKSFFQEIFFVFLANLGCFLIIPLTAYITAKVLKNHK